MKAFLALLFLLGGAVDTSNGEKMSLISEEESRRVFERELRKTANNFQANLRTQLLGVESELYGELQAILESLGASQDGLSRELSEELTREKVNIQRKLGKVVTYCSLMAQNLYKQLHGVLQLLGRGTAQGEDVESTLMFSQEDYLPATPYTSEFSNRVRSRRHTLNDSHFTGFLESLGDFNSDYRHSERMEQMVKEVLDANLTDTSPSSAEHLPRDCLEVLAAGNTKDGVYIIHPTGVGVEAWCDLTSEGGGWTVVVERRSGQPEVNFTRPALHYRHGFGHPHTQHWIGLEHMRALTEGTNTSLRVHLVDQLQQSFHVAYSTFSVGGREGGYRLLVEGYDPTSTAGDSLSLHSGAAFVSPQPFPSGSRCEDELEVGWWFLEPPLCYLALPTAQSFPQWRPQGHRSGRGWWEAGHSFLTLTFKIRRQLL